MGVGGGIFYIFIMLASLLFFHGFPHNFTSETETELKRLSILETHGSESLKEIGTSSQEGRCLNQTVGTISLFFMKTRTQLHTASF